MAGLVPAIAALGMAMAMFQSSIGRHRAGWTFGASLIFQGFAGPAFAEVCDKQGGFDDLFVYIEFALIALAAMAFVAVSRVRTPWLFFVLGMLMTAPTLLSLIVLKESLELSGYSFSTPEACLTPKWDLAGFGLLICLTFMFFSFGIWKARERRSL